MALLGMLTCCIRPASRGDYFYSERQLSGTQARYGHGPNAQQELPPLSKEYSQEPATVFTYNEAYQSNAQAAQVGPLGLDSLICDALPAVVTVFTQQGVPLHQNPSSLAYYGHRVDAACGHGTECEDNLLVQLFRWEPIKLERMLLEVMREGGGSWKGIVRVPPSMLHVPWRAPASGAVALVECSSPYTAPAAAAAAATVAAGAVAEGVTVLNVGDQGLGGHLRNGAEGDAAPATGPLQVRQPNTCQPPATPEPHRVMSRPAARSASAGGAAPYAGQPMPWALGTAPMGSGPQSAGNAGQRRAAPRRTMTYGGPALGDSRPDGIGASQTPSAHVVAPVVRTSASLASRFPLRTSASLVNNRGAPRGSTPGTTFSRRSAHAYISTETVKPHADAARAAPAGPLPARTPQPSLDYNNNNPVSNIANSSRAGEDILRLSNSHSIRGVLESPFATGTVSSVLNNAMWDSAGNPLATSTFGLLLGRPDGLPAAALPMSALASLAPPTNTNTNTTTTSNANVFGVASNANHGSGTAGTAAAPGTGIMGVASLSGALVRVLDPTARRIPTTSRPINLISPRLGAAAAAAAASATVAGPSSAQANQPSQRLTPQLLRAPSVESIGAFSSHVLSFASSLRNAPPATQLLADAARGRSCQLTRPSPGGGGGFLSEVLDPEAGEEDDTAAVAVRSPSPTGKGLGPLSAQGLGSPSSPFDERQVLAAFLDAACESHGVPHAAQAPSRRRQSPNARPPSIHPSSRTQGPLPSGLPQPLGPAPPQSPRGLFPNNAQERAGEQSTQAGSGGPLPTASGPADAALAARPSAAAAAVNAHTAARDSATGPALVSDLDNAQFHARASTSTANAVSTAASALLVATTAAAESLAVDGCRAPAVMTPPDLPTFDWLLACSAPSSAGAAAHGSMASDPAVNRRAPTPLTRLPTLPPLQDEQQRQQRQQGHSPRQELTPQEPALCPPLQPMAQQHGVQPSPAPQRLQLHAGTVRPAVQDPDPQEEGDLQVEQEGKQQQEEEEEGPECWHEVWATRARDPVTYQDVIVLAQRDVSAKVVAERHLALVMEAEHRLLEQLFPKHILTHVTEEWIAEAEGLTPAHAPAPAGRRAGHAPGGRSNRWRPVIRDCNSLATWHPEVTLLLADIKGFTPMCKCVAPRAVMTMLNALFSRFDALLDKFGVFKVETIGDAYFVAGGLIREDEDGMAAVRDGRSRVDPLHAARIFGFARAMLRAAREVRMPSSGEPVQIRIGISSGPVVSGVVGSRMPRFCLFGDTVHTASRMENTGVPGCIHASEETYALLREEAWQPTAGVEVRGKGLMQTYLWAPPQAEVERAGEKEHPPPPPRSAATTAASDVRNALPPHSASGGAPGAVGNGPVVAEPVAEPASKLGSAAVAGLHPAAPASRPRG